MRVLHPTAFIHRYHAGPTRRSIMKYPQVARNQTPTYPSHASYNQWDMDWYPLGYCRYGVGNDSQYPSSTNGDMDQIWMKLDMIPKYSQYPSSTLGIVGIWHCCRRGGRAQHRQASWGAAPLSSTSSKTYLVTLETHGEKEKVIRWRYNEMSMSYYIKLYIVPYSYIYIYI